MKKEKFQMSKKLLLNKKRITVLTADQSVVVAGGATRTRTATDTVIADNTKLNSCTPNASCHPGGGSIC